MISLASTGVPRLGCALLSLSLAPALHAQDPFEPNDTCGAAAALPLGATPGLTLGPDDDHYRISVPAEALVEVAAVGAGAATVELYEADCLTLLATGAGTLRFADCGGAARDLVVRVSDASATDLPYSLEVAAASIVDDSFEPNDTCTGGAPSVVRDYMTPGLVVTRCNDDYWAIGIQPNNYEVQFDVLHDAGQGALVVELLDNSCQVIPGAVTTTAHGYSARFINPLGTLQGIKLRVAAAPGTQLVDYTLIACFGGANFTPLIGYQACAGLANSTGVPAGICAWGSDVAASNGVHLYVGDLPANSFGYFIASRTYNFVATPGNTMGNLCLGAPGRYSYAILNSGSGFVGYQPDLTATPLPGGAFTAAVATDRWYWQYWYRDAIGGMATSNFSGALYIDFL